jgi:NADH:ubiquinone oxidoreductase subunit E
MKTERSNLPKEIVQYIDECRARPHGESYLISVLQRLQQHVGYLDREHMEEVSQRMQIPSAKVSGVATFYHLFTFEPKGRYRISLCMGTACYVRGAERVLERLRSLLGIDLGGTTPDGEFSIECARCLGACALAPVMLVNDRVYGNVKPGDVPGILAEYGFETEGAKT